MNKHNGWNSLGDTRELERKVKRIREIEDMAEWGDKTLKLIADMDYLNGCVKRGRGSDITPDYPAQNVFEYLKELESTVSALTQENEELKKSLKLVQSHAKKAMDGLPAKWDQGFQAGQESAGFSAIESARGMLDIKQQWSSDNAKFTEEIIKLEEELDALKEATQNELP